MATVRVTGFIILLPAGPPNLQEGSQCLVWGASCQPALVAETSQVLRPHCPILANPGEILAVDTTWGGEWAGPRAAVGWQRLHADCSGPSLRASRPSHPSSRARAAATTRAIQTGEGRVSRPRASEKRALAQLGAWTPRNLTAQVSP